MGTVKVGDLISLNGQTCRVMQLSYDLKQTNIYANAELEAYYETTQLRSLAKGRAVEEEWYFGADYDYSRLEKEDKKEEIKDEKKEEEPKDEKQVR